MDWTGENNSEKYNKNDFDLKKDTHKSISTENADILEDKITCCFLAKYTRNPTESVCNHICDIWISFRARNIIFYFIATPKIKLLPWVQISKIYFNDFIRIMYY